MQKKFALGTIHILFFFLVCARLHFMLSILFASMCSFLRFYYTICCCCCYRKPSRFGFDHFITIHLRGKTVYRMQKTYLLVISIQISAKFSAQTQSKSKNVCFIANHQLSTHTYDKYSSFSSILLYGFFFVAAALTF